MMACRPGIGNPYGGAYPLMTAIGQGPAAPEMCESCRRARPGVAARVRELEPRPGAPHSTSGGPRPITSGAAIPLVIMAVPEGEGAGIQGLGYLSITNQQGSEVSRYLRSGRRIGISPVPGSGTCP